MILKYRELDGQSKTLRKKTCVVNIYDNRVEKKYTWKNNICCTKKAIKDIQYESIIQVRVLMTGEINTHSLL